MLIDHQWDRQNKKINSLIHRSAMTQNVSVLDIDYTSNRKLDKTQYERMLSFAFSQQQRKHYDIGPAGIRKSYLAQAIGYQACHMLHKTQSSLPDCLTMHKNASRRKVSQLPQGVTQNTFTIRICWTHPFRRCTNTIGCNRKQAPQSFHNYLLRYP